MRPKRSHTEIISLELKSFFWILLGGILLMTAAFLNGFPLIYPDTSTFIESAFHLETPFDRPITYGLFLSLTSLNGSSIWLVIFSQAFLLSLVIFLLTKLFWENEKLQSILFVGVMVFISFFTSASWTSSQLITDIFTPIMILVSMLLLLGKWSRRLEVFLYFLFMLSTSMHMSHISFNAVTFTCILLLRQWIMPCFKETTHLKPIFICIALSLLSILSMGSALSKSKHAFLMGALVENGIAKTFLDEHCDHHSYEFCKYKDSLPKYAWQFIWDESSPFYKMGSFPGTKNEFNSIINQTLTSPKYIILHVKESLKSTAHQLLNFKIGEGSDPMGSESILFQRMEIHFPNEMDAFTKSKQNENKLQFLSSYNVLLTGVIVFSLAVVIFLIFKCETKVRTILLLTLLSVVINSWVCGTFASSIGRLGAKVIWLIPLMAFIGLAKLAISQKQ